MKRLILFMMAVALALQAGINLDGDIPVNPFRAPVGTWTCVFPVAYSSDGHYWAPADSFYQRSDSGCIMLAEKTEAGWMLWRNQITVWPHSADKFYGRYGWVKFFGERP